MFLRLCVRAPRMLIAFIGEGVGGRQAMPGRERVIG
jgi:hypothetical protein